MRKNRINKKWQMAATGKEKIQRKDGQVDKERQAQTSKKKYRMVSVRRRKTGGGDQIKRMQERSALQDETSGS